MKYKRILLKISGEALAGKQGFGICRDTLQALAHEILDIHNLGVEIAIVVGGGNIHRGVSGATRGMDRTTSDIWECWPLSSMLWPFKIPSNT